MKVIVAAIHGIMTGMTDASWPDRLEGFLLGRDPDVHVVKRKYFELPTPRLNWFKNRWLARGLANELRVLLGETSNFKPQTSGKVQTSSSNPEPAKGPIRTGPGVPYSLWFVAHSNGAVISLMAARRLIGWGYKIGGMILTGAAVEADLRQNEIFKWYCGAKVFAAIAYSSPDDAVTAGDARAARFWLWKARDWIWGKLMWPYGSLGRTGWLLDGKPYKGTSFLYTRWQAGGHSTYFTAAKSAATFEQMFEDMSGAEEARGQSLKLQASSFRESSNCK